MPDVTEINTNHRIKEVLDQFPMNTSDLKIKIGAECPGISLVNIHRLYSGTTKTLSADKARLLCTFLNGIMPEGWEKLNVNDLFIMS